MNAKTLKKLRRAAVIVRNQMFAHTSGRFPEALLGPPPTPRQVYRRLKAREAHR